MSFYVKVTLAVLALIALAFGAMLLFSSSEEKVIQKRLEEGLAAAEAGNEDGVIALISPSYANGGQTREAILKRIHQAVAQRISPARLEGAAVQVSGDDADANVRVVIGALQYRREFGLHLKLKKENGVWMVTSAEEVGGGAGF